MMFVSTKCDYISNFFFSPLKVNLIINWRIKFLDRENYEKTRILILKHEQILREINDLTFVNTL